MRSESRRPCSAVRRRAPRAGALLAAAALVWTVAAGGAVPAGAEAGDPFAANAAVAPALRYPLVQPVSGRVESLIGGGCPSARAHTGIDISSTDGVATPVLAAFGGFARAVDAGDGYGLTVEIVHLGGGTGYLTRYAHLSTAAVGPEGRWVGQGEVVGATGASGNAQTVHLHFELRDAAGAVVDLNPAFRSCRRDVEAGTPLAIDVPGLVSPAALAVEALGPNTWAAAVGPGATAPEAADCRYWDRATDDGADEADEVAGRCPDGAGDGDGRGRRVGVGVGVLTDG